MFSLGCLKRFCSPFFAADATSLPNDCDFGEAGVDSGKLSRLVGARWRLGVDKDIDLERKLGYIFRYVYRYILIGLGLGETANHPQV